MIRNPKIPMLPTELPQQRIHEVVDLPERPDQFDNCEIDYSALSSCNLPKNGPSKSTYLCQVEWAWSPMHNRLDAYYLHRGLTHWVLWSKYWDDNWMKWEQVAIGCVPHRGVTQKQAAVYLLLEFWAFDAKESDVDHYHWINEDAFLSVSEVAEIARVIWG
jgi:hypothetical protein